MIRKNRLEVNIAVEKEVDLGVNAIYTPTAPVNFKRVSLSKSVYNKS